MFATSSVLMSRKSAEVNTLVRRLVCLAALALVFIAMSSAAQAQSIRYRVQVNGYSKYGGWVEIVSGRNLGGAVVEEKGRYITDRAQRGEAIEVILADSGAKCRIEKAIAIVTSNQQFVAGSLVSLPYTGRFAVSNSPNFDNVYVEVYNLDTRRTSSRRVPIGSRPARRG